MGLQEGEKRDQSRVFQVIINIPGPGKTQFNPENQHIIPPSAIICDHLRHYAATITETLEQVM
jgi:hypothetical protein